MQIVISNFDKNSKLKILLFLILHDNDDNTVIIIA